MFNMENLFNFEAAVNALNNGKRVAREGWNGKGMYIFKQVPSSIDAHIIVPKMQSLPETVKENISNRLRFNTGDSAYMFNHIKYENQLCIMYPNNVLYGYSPSTSDVLAEDWVILDIEAKPQPIKPSDTHTGKSFGLAIEALKKGGKAWRTGWNGKDMFLYHVPAASYPSMTPIMKETFGDNLVPYRQYLALKTAQGDVATWSPSNSDVFENDWEFTDKI